MPALRPGRLAPITPSMAIAPSLGGHWTCLLGVGCAGLAHSALVAEVVGAMISVSFVSRCTWYNVSLSVCRSWFPSHLCHSSSCRYSNTWSWFP